MCLQGFVKLYSLPFYETEFRETQIKKSQFMNSYHNANDSTAHPKNVSFSGRLSAVFDFVDYNGPFY